MMRHAKEGRTARTTRRRPSSGRVLTGIPGVVLTIALAATAAGPPPGAKAEARRGPSPANQADAATSPPSAILDRASVPAAGSHEAIIEVSRFGRYAVAVQSAQGTAIQIVDRMAGPGETRGTAGEADGRIDLFLDRGQYKVLTQGPEKGKGDARLSVHPFGERAGSALTMLVELKPVEDRLEDFEQISYGIEVTERRRVILEAAGRDLADLRLWQNASWLVDAQPLVEAIEPKPGRRLRLCRLTADLAPGAYVVTAYGGPARPWAEESSDHPFYLRLGIPTLGEAGRDRLVSSPFGFDRFLVPAKANLYRLELPDPRLASLSVAPYDPDAPFAGGGRSVDITKNSSPPVAEIEAGFSQSSGDGRLNVVSITSEAGLPYVLEHFERSNVYTFETSGEYWISSIRTGAAADSMDSTVLVVRSEPIGEAPPARESRPQGIEPFLSHVIEVDGTHAWARRCNLLGGVTAYVHVGSAGKYQIVSSGTPARFKIEPFLLSVPPEYQSPPYEASGFAWNLEPGYYVLNIAPDRFGIIDIAIRPSGLLDTVKTLIGMTPKPGEPGAAVGSVVFPQVHLEETRRYTAYHNLIPEVKVGFVLRRLPLDLGEPLPVAQRPGETLSFPFEVREPGELRAVTDDGTALEVSVDGETARKSPAVAAGAHRASIAVTGSSTVQYSLRFEPLRLDPATPLPAATDPSLTAPPSFPVLTEAAPTFFDLDRGGSATWLVRADEPGLYRLQTTGLLATSGNLRTRLITSFERQAGNGVGRNFLIQQYLREGEYQVTIATQGASRGHLGARLDRTRVTDGGDLLDGAPARRTLATGEAVTYGFEIREAGDYRLRASSLSGRLRGRLEDDAGWPILPPGGEAEIERRFEPGRYRLVVLPEAVAMRTVTLLERTRAPLRFEGHGPHDLPLSTRVDHVWLEPEKGGERVPDTWVVQVPAPIDAAIDLTGEMEGSLDRVEDGQARQVAPVPPGRGWKGSLEAGTYRLEATCSRVNNRAAYQVEVRAEQLVAGTSKRIQAPAVVKVSVGREGLAVLESSGPSDVRARLLDAEGRLVASNDDRDDDWNFEIATSLGKGAYRLEVDPVGEARASCTVAMAMPEEKVEAPLALPVAKDIELGSGVHVFPLDPFGKGDLLVVGARSREPVTLAVEVSEGERWDTAVSSSGREVRVAVPTGSEKLDVSIRYRLRLWSGDPRARIAHLTAVVVDAQRASESQLRKGIDLRPVSGIDPPMAAAAVSLGAPGLFHLERGNGVLRWSAARGHGCEEAVDEVVPARTLTLWLTADLSGSGEIRTVRGSRIVLEAGAARAVQVRIPARTAAVCDIPSPKEGPVAVFASSTVGMPGVRLEESKSGHFVPWASAMAVGARSAAAVSLAAKRPVAVAWAAADSGGPIEVRLVQQSFDAPAVETAAFGEREGSISGFEAKAFGLPGGTKRLRLTLGGGIVGVLSNGDDVESVHWTGGTTVDETVETAATRLTLLHVQKQADRFSLEMLPVTPEESSPALAAGAPYEHRHTTGGTLRLQVAPYKVGPVGRFTLHVRTAGTGLPDAGDSAKPVLVENGGEVKRGNDLPLGMDGGTIAIAHPPGLVLAWVDQPGEEARDLWGEGDGGAAKDVTPPAVVPLSGRTQVLRLSLAAPSLVHLRAAAPVLTRLRRGQEAPEVDLHPSGCVLDAFVPAGAAEIALRSVAGGMLTGTAELTASPVNPVGEGLGPPTMLPPGGSRAFSFATTRKGEVGIGVRASSDLVDCRLLDAKGKQLGSGLVQMANLDPGTYLVVLRVPEGGRPAVVRPAIVGIEPPGTGPPEEVIRSYLEKAGLRPPATVTAPVHEPERQEEQDLENNDEIDRTQPADEEGD